MRILRLTLENYRAIGAAQTFSFGERFTVVAGVNGRGKTAILDGLALLFSRLLPLVSPARSGYRRMEPSDVHTDQPSAKMDMRVNCAGIPIEYGVSYERESRRLSTTKLPAAVRQAAKHAYGDPLRADDAAPLVVYYTTDRAGYRLPKAVPTDVPRGQAAAYLGSLFNRTVNFRDFMARYRVATLPDTAGGDATPFMGQRAVQAVSTVLSAFLGNFTNLRVETEPVRLLVDKQGESLDVSQLSDGERANLALCCDLVRRLALANPALPNPLDGAGVVLIDEIELHLHPKWQREIVEKLRSVFPNIQFVATTHSPFVIQSLRAGELINLDPEEFGEYADRSIEDIAENVMGVDLPQKSERYQRMMEAAEEYFKLVRAAATPGDIAAAQERLNELSIPFSDDPAFQALLKLERESKTNGGDDAAS